MTVTRRGWVVIASGFGAIVAGGQHGARALDAIAVPALVLVVVGLVWVARLDRPTVERTVADPDAVGTTHTLSLRVDSSGLVSIHDELTGVSPSTVDRPIETGTWIDYRVRYDQRGHHSVGPLTVTVSDPLGLFTRSFRYTATESLVVYPPVSSITPPDALSALAQTSGAIERQEFERLREHVPGESLSSVDWKTSAKHDELFVVEYSRSESDAVEIAAESIGSQQNADEMARTVASLVGYLCDRGVPVSVTIPEGTLSSEQPGFFERLLYALAATSPGRVPTSALSGADVTVVGQHATATITIDGTAFSFDDCRNRARTADDRARGVVST